MRNEITFHFDGSIAEHHQISLRTLSTTLKHLQSAIDRAYIDLQYGAVRKHARLRHQDYPFTDFVVGTPRDGGYILGLFNAGRLAIVDRLDTAIRRAYSSATEQVLPVAQTLSAQAASRRENVLAGVQHPSDRATLIQKYGVDGQVARYADRSINKEIDQVLAQIRLSRYADSTLELSLAGNSAHPPFIFDQHKAQQFHRAVSTKWLGDPVSLDIRVRAMDRGAGTGSMTGKGTHAETGRDFTLYFGSPEDFNRLAQYMVAGDDQPIIRIVASPVIEFGTYDAEAGDMYFLAIDKR